MLSLGVLASGRGSNLGAILEAIDRGELRARVDAVLSDQPQARALTRARERDIHHQAFPLEHYASRAAQDEAMADALEAAGVHLVVLAGYMRVLSPAFIQRFANRIVNIHPALLPSFPGLHAQRQAVEYGVRFSGCTVHFVDEGMDSGPIILQAVVPVMQDDTEETLAARILKEEHRLYPKALQILADGRAEVQGRRVHILE